MTSDGAVEGSRVIKTSFALTVALVATFTAPTIPLVCQLNVTICFAEIEPEDSTAFAMLTCDTTPVVGVLEEVALAHAASSAETIINEMTIKPVV